MAVAVVMAVAVASGGGGGGGGGGGSGGSGGGGGYEHITPTVIRPPPPPDCPIPSDEIRCSYLPLLLQKAFTRYDEPPAFDNTLYFKPDTCSNSNDVGFTRKYPYLHT